ncbi:glycosyl transferase, partial [Vibrio anguillarum]|nr:glycosyl transferase [Vibrio anguillarum]
MNMSQVTVLIANRLIRLTGNIFKILAYPVHWVFPKLRFTIPAYSPAKLARSNRSAIPRTIWQTNFT